MELKTIISWVLLISTFLIAGKAFNLLNISWIIAFGPMAILMASLLAILIVSFIYMYKTISKQNKEDGE